MNEVIIMLILLVGAFILTTIALIVEKAEDNHKAKQNRMKAVAEFYAISETLDNRWGEVDI